MCPMRVPDDFGTCRAGTWEDEQGRQYEYIKGGSKQATGLCCPRAVVAVARRHMLCCRALNDWSPLKGVEWSCLKVSGVGNVHHHRAETGGDATARTGGKGKMFAGGGHLVVGGARVWVELS